MRVTKERASNVSRSSMCSPDAEGEQSSEWQKSSEWQRWRRLACADEYNRALCGGNRGERAAALGVAVKLGHDYAANLHCLLERLRLAANVTRYPFVFGVLSGKSCGTWSTAAWPMELSMTNTISSGWTASTMACISSNRLCSCLCRPLVSTMIRSMPSFLNFSTPCLHTHARVT